MTHETMQIGQVTCDFMRLEDFLHTCRVWLKSSDFHHVVTLNPEMVVEAQTDDKFREAMAKADLRVPDGAGLIWAQWYVRSQFWSLFSSLVAFSFRQAERITGVDTVTALAQAAVHDGVGVYLLGGTVHQVTKTATKLKGMFPTLRIHTSADHAFDVNGPIAILQDIQQAKPAILFVAYGAPKQTIWIEKHRADLPSVRIAVGVGGAFAILSEERPRAPKFFRQLNVEWLWRLFLEPSRLPRIWRATVDFPMLVKRQKMQQR